MLRCFRTKRRAVADPRWDVEGFNAWADKCRLAWVRVGYLRELHARGRIIPYRQLAADGSLLIGAPPTDVQLYAASPYTCLGQKAPGDSVVRGRPTQDEPLHHDPDGFHLSRLVLYLNEDRAFDDDLVVMFHISAFHFRASAAEESAYAAYLKGSIFVNTYYRIKTIVLFEVPETYKGEPVVTRLWGVHEFHLAAYCQRIVNSTAPLVKPNLTPERLRSANQQVRDAHTTKEEDRELILRTRRQVLSSILPARDDALGFQRVCEEAGYRWVRVWFVQELASRGGPAPRGQDLPYGSFVDGRVPPGKRHFVVSHSWVAHLHFDPGGDKLRRLAAALARLGAERDDVVFVDYMSLAQAGGWVPKTYLEFNPEASRHVERTEGEMVLLGGRTEAQERRFRFGLFECTRLYAYRHLAYPSVIVLPEIDPPERFPSPGEIVWEENTVCQPPRREQKSAWGFSKSLAYEDCGWPCAEYAVSRMSGNIANGEDEAVVHVEAARDWPEDVDAYGELMDEAREKPVVFTKKGDREVVRFNFYKFSYKVTE